MYFSLAEQDLAFRSNVFFGSSQSEWSKMISIDRQAEMKPDCSILDFLVNDKCNPIILKTKEKSPDKNIYQNL